MTKRQPARLLAAALILVAPLLVAASGHDGQPHRRTAPELSDVALFVVAVVAVWLTRRALRRRAATRKG